MPLFLVLGIEPRPSSESFATSSNDMPVTTHEDAISLNRQSFALATATRPCPIGNHQARYTLELYNFRMLRLDSAKQVIITGRNRPLNLLTSYDSVYS